MTKQWQLKKLIFKSDKQYKDSSLTFLATTFQLQVNQVLSFQFRSSHCSCLFISTVNGISFTSGATFSLFKKSQMENNTSNKTASGAPISEFASRAGVWYWVLRGLIGLTILAGNGPVIYVIVTSHRLHKAANWFILSLSWADLFVGLFLIPVSTSCALWTTCNFSVLSLSFDLLLFVSIANMGAMTADRYLSVVKPLTYFQNMTNLRVFLWISVAWIVPILFSLIPFAWIFSNSPAQRESAFQIYGTLQIITFNLLPCVVMLLIYGHIFIISQKHSRQIRALTKHQNFSQPQFALNPPQATQERSATRVFGLVVLFFVLCWMLSAYRHLCQYFSLKCRDSFELALVSRLLMVTNSAINPFIYAFLKEDIKREVKKLLCRRKPRTVSFTTNIQSAHSHRQRREPSNSVVINA